VTAGAMLEVESLSAGYGKVSVVRDVNLTVAEGEIVTLLGANGAGKTTTLRAITGALRPFAGRITVKSEVPRSLKLHRLRALGVSYIPQDRCLFSDLTLGENLRLVRGGMPFPELLKWFPQLEALASRRAGLLSGGEQQMLTLARALACRPRILLIDEMSTGLAPIIVERLTGLLRRLADEEGIGVLLVEQHVDLALRVSDRGYVLRHGEMVAEGPAADLLRNREALEANYFGEVAS
jgi:branched-chain amino acid transport system ATP-binding protein